MSSCWSHPAGVEQYEYFTAGVQVQRKLGSTGASRLSERKRKKEGGRIWTQREAASLEAFQRGITSKCNVLLSVTW